MGKTANYNTRKIYSFYSGFQLSVSAAGYEDTAFYECTLLNTDQTASVAVAVCGQYCTYDKDNWITIITSTYTFYVLPLPAKLKKVMFPPQCVLFFCLSVCNQEESRRYEWTVTKLAVYDRH